MTDLEKHVNQPGRAKLVKSDREKINELGITPPYGGEDIITETGIQMVSELTSEDLITEQAP